MSVSIVNYTRRKTPAYCVTISTLDLYFSYKACIAFTDGHQPTRVSANLWGPTTGRHISDVPGGSDKSSRLAREDFERELAEVLKRRGLDS